MMSRGRGVQQITKISNAIQPNIFLPNDSGSSICVGGCATGIIRPMISANNSHPEYPLMPGNTSNNTY